MAPSFLDAFRFQNLLPFGLDGRQHPVPGLGRWITYYNTQRPHSGLAGRTPVEAYRRIGQSDHGGHAPHDLLIRQAA
ncbi:MAG: integrase core domain-containing protein [Caenibius sp.]